ncbi:hypothetical protein [Kocuria oceani]|uniref:Uncharacterized protein n=1 Tax=Kocuria oceani TaxID=988827 RepID=A0ABV9TM58_9MICC|nr:hypothetical protein [Kocuria oceani]
MESVKAIYSGCSSFTTLGWLALHCQFQGPRSVQGRGQFSPQSLRFVLGFLAAALLMSVRPALFDGLRSGGLDLGSRLLMHIENYGVPSLLGAAPTDAPEDRRRGF